MKQNKHTITGVIVFDANEKEYKFTDWPTADRFENGVYSTEYFDYVLVCEHEITFTIPDGFDIIKPQLDALDRQEGDLRAQFHLALQHIQTQRNNLLAIELSEA